MARTLLIALLSITTGATAVSWEEAKCIVDGRKVCLFGDSNMRFSTFNFNTFIETGEENEDYGDWGEQGPPTSNSGVKDNTWTDGIGRSAATRHHQDIPMDFSSVDASSRFKFITSTWFKDGSIGDDNDCDVVIINSGWWDLKSFDDSDAQNGYEDCGEDFTDDCGDKYEEDIAKLVKATMDKADAGVWRESSCCGDWSSPKPQDEDEAGPVKAQNAIAKKYIEDKTDYEFVEVFDLYTDVSGTKDGTHALPKYYSEWTQLYLEAMDKQLKTGCLGGGGGGSGSGSGSGSEASDSEEDSEESGGSCKDKKGKDDKKWSYKNKKKKNCKWAKKKGKCGKKGINKKGKTRTGYESCCKSCK